MRVGLIISGSLSNTSGGYLYDRMLVKHLQDNDHSIRVMALPGQNYHRRLLENFAPSRLTKPGTEPPDILLQDELEHPALFLLNRRLKNQISCPIISIVHHLRSDELRPAWQNHLYRTVERRYLSSVDGFIFNSESTRSAVTRLCSKPLPSVVAKPCGNPKIDLNISESEITARAKQPGPLRIVFLGQVIPRKGLHILLSVLARLPVESFSLSVVGSLLADRNYVRDIKKQIAGSGLGKRVTLLDTLPDDELAVHLRGAHVLAVPSSYEGFGIVYLEGMGFGLPAIGSAAGGAGEVITHGENGFLIEAGDVSTLTECLRKLHWDRNRLALMARNAYRYYQCQPGWNQTCRQITLFLENMVNERIRKEGAIK